MNQFWVSVKVPASLLWPIKTGQLIIQYSASKIPISWYRYILAEFWIKKKFIGFQKVFVTHLGHFWWLITNWFRVWVLFGIRELLKYWFCEEIRLILKFFFVNLFLALHLIQLTTVINVTGSWVLTCNESSTLIGQGEPMRWRDYQFMAG